MIIGVIENAQERVIMIVPERERNIAISRETLLAKLHDGKGV